MTSKTRKQIIETHTLPNVSRCKGNLAIKFGQLIEHNVKIHFFKDHAENEAGRIVPDRILPFEKAL